MMAATAKGSATMSPKEQGQYDVLKRMQIIALAINMAIIIGGGFAAYQIQRYTTDTTYKSIEKFEEKIGSLNGALSGMPLTQENLRRLEREVVALKESVASIDRNLAAITFRLDIRDQRETWDKENAQSGH